MVLGELRPDTTHNVSTKRKHADAISEESRVDKRPAYEIHDKENDMNTIMKIDQAQLRSPASVTSSLSQETLADAPDSQDTVTDPNLPSSSSDTRNSRLHALTPPRSNVKQIARVHENTDSVNGTRELATNIKCRLKLAMYKMKCHKEELNYKRLLPRQSSVFRIGMPPTPLSQEQPAKMVAKQSPGLVTSIVSDERSLPGMQRSSSGEAGLVETPVRRNYDIGLSSPPASQENLQLHIEPRLSNVRPSNPGQNLRSNVLPPIRQLVSWPVPSSDAAPEALQDTEKIT